MPRMFFHQIQACKGWLNTKLLRIASGFVLALLFIPFSGMSYSLPFHDNFDSTGIWTVQHSGGSSWEQGVPNFGSTSTAHSPSSCWDIELNAPYRDSSLTCLVSPVITFNGEYNTLLSFWQNFNTEDYFDGTRLEYSINGGSWTTLGLSGDADGHNWYTRNNIEASNRPAWCGNSNGWIQSSYTLVPLNGISGNVQFRFVFTSGDSLTFDGYSIDDFSIEFASPNDAEIISVFYPMPIALENSFDSIHVVIKNHGSLPITAMDLGYSIDAGMPLRQAWTGNLLPAETDTFRFSTLWFVQSGFNSLCVFTDLPGDGDHSNDQICKVIQALPLSTVPYADDYEISSGTWIDSSATGTQWENGLPSFGTTTSTHSGNSCWDLNLNSAYQNHAESYLYSSFFDFTNLVNAKLSFWQNRNTEKRFDGFCLEYSTNSGISWNLLGSAGEENSSNWYSDSSIAGLGNSPGWDGNSNGWIQSSCILSALNNAGAHVQFRFRFESDGSNTADGVSIDDFSIQAAPAVDMSLNRLASPSGNKTEGSIDTISIRVRNLGASDIAQFTVNYGVAGEAMKAFNWNGLLHPSEALDIIIDTLEYRASDFILTISIQTTADGDVSNDSISQPLFGIPLLKPPYASDPEFVRNFYTGSGNTVWEWGRPQSTIINDVYTGNKCWKTNLDGDYSNRMNEYLYSPLFDFSNAYSPVIKFNHWMNAEQGMDGGRLEYSKDAGNTWNTLGTVADPLGVNWYTNASIFSSNKPAWSGNTVGYIESSYRMNMLSGYSGGLVQFRFNFSSNDSITANGWAVDAFRIESQPAYSARPSELMDVQDPFSPGAASQIVGCYIYNSGARSFQNVNVNLVEDGQIILHDSVQLISSLLPGDSVLHTFSQAWVSSPGLHTICVRTLSPGNHTDEWTADDEACTVAGVFDTLPAIDQNGWCEDFEGSNYSWLTMNPLTGKFQNEEWTLGNPGQNYLNGSYNGSLSWTTDSMNVYKPGDASALYTPVFVADSSACYKLSFYHRYKTEQFEDGGTVEYSKDNGNTWNVIGNSGEPGWYNSSYISGLKLPPVPGWSGTSNGWELASHDLYFPDKSNVVFRFRFGSDASVQDEGWQIDNFCLQKLSSCVIGVNELNAAEIQLYPNPVIDNLNVQIDSGIENIRSVSVINILGEELKEFEQSSISPSMNMNTNGLSEGIYRLKVNTNSGVLYLKFIKM